MFRTSLTAAVSALALVCAAHAVSAQGAAPGVQSAAANAATGQSAAGNQAATTPLPPSAPMVGVGAGRQALQACRSDMATLCADGGTGRRGKLQCLRDSTAKLSADCKAAIQVVLDRQGARKAAAGGAIGRVVPACQADIATVCGDIQKGQGRMAKCLKDNAAKVSTACQAGLADLRATRQRARAACAGDVASLCSAGGQPKAGLACVREKQGEASAACQQALAALPQRNAKRQKY